MLGMETNEWIRASHVAYVRWFQVLLQMSN